MKTKEELRAFMDKQEVALIGSIDEEGFPNQKAMLKPRNMEGISTIYFSTNTSSARVAQYRVNPKASVYFFQKGLVKYQGLLLVGTMEVLEDEATKRELWRVGDQVYYPKGVTDPDYCVLRFTAIRGRYYCNLKTESFTL